MCRETHFDLEIQDPIFFEKVKIIAERMKSVKQTISDVHCLKHSLEHRYA